MEVTFEVNELEKMKRPELQQLCKSFGIKANMKVRNFHSMISEFLSFLLISIQHALNFSSWFDIFCDNSENVCWSVLVNLDFPS